MTERLRIAFSLFYLAISTFFVINIINSTFSLFSIFGIWIFGTALYFTVFRWIFKYVKLKNNYYLITNQRVIIAKKSSGKIVKYQTLNEIHQINAEMNDKFFGNIIFGEPENIFGKSNEPFSLFKRRGMNFEEDKYVFLSVENINEIIPVFEELGLKVTKTFY